MSYNHYYVHFKAPEYQGGRTQERRYEQDYSRGHICRFLDLIDEFKEYEWAAIFDDSIGDNDVFFYFFKSDEAIRAAFPNTEFGESDSSGEHSQRWLFRDAMRIHAEELA